MALNLKKKALEKVKQPESISKLHTILLVDDEESNLSSLKRILDPYYHIVTACDGQEALKLIEESESPDSFHLIISDQRMPHMNGIDFLTKTIPIIPKTIRMILTGYTDIEAIIDSINQGQVYKFLTKPIEPQDLLITVKRALETFELEAQNVILSASNRRLNELNQAKTQVMQTINDFYQTDLSTLLEQMRQCLQGGQEPLATCRGAMKILDEAEQKLKPITKLYFSEKTINNKRVLLAEANKKQQIISKLALGGTGVTLDIANDLASGAELIAERDYHMICVTLEMVQLVPQMLEKNPNTQVVFMTSETAPTYLATLKKYPCISNIVSRNDMDRTFTLKNIQSTVSKLLNQDIFGLEKYLNWGVELQEREVVDSLQRSKLVDEMHGYFNHFGVKRTVIDRVCTVAEELLMNSIYDAPVGADGQTLYNHLDRTVNVQLKPEERSTLRYAFDGMLLGVSVEDPFGAFEKLTVLEYIESGYAGKAGMLQDNKGGAGRGLFQIMESADLVVFNIKPKIKTEVIALFNMESPNMSRRQKSFHYFSI